MTGRRRALPAPRVLGQGLRVAAASGLLLGAVAFALVLGARVRAEDVVEDAGRYFLHGAREQPRTGQVLHVNGLPLRMEAGLLRQSVRTVLDGWGELCGASGRVLRAQSDAGGHLACLDLRTPEPGMSEIVQRLRAFAISFDLAAIGDLRVVWALREREGTAFVAVSSEGPVRLSQLFPRSGDAPGVDLQDIPRPPGGRRVLSAWQAGHPAMLASYRVELGAVELAARYRRRLIDGGFAVRPGGGPPGGAPRWLLADRAGAFTAVAIDGDGAAHSTVTLLPLR
jgi:hypothetical protein